MLEIEKPGELEAFQGTIEKIKSEHIWPNADFAKIISKDLGALEMKNWEVYKKLVRDFYKELNVKDLNIEEQLLRGMYNSVEAILKHLPVKYDNNSKGLFYNWLKGRFHSILTYLEDIFRGHLPAVSLENMKNDMKENIAFFDKVS